LILIFEKLRKRFYFKAFGKKGIKSRSQTGIIFGDKDSPTRVMVFGDSNAYRPENGRVPPLVAEYRRYASRENISIIDLYPVIDIGSDLEPDCVHIKRIGRKKVADIVWKNLQGIYRQIDKDSKSTLTP
jgi:hypothetical protein